MAAAPSLHKRLLLASSLALVAFLGVTGLILDAAFQESARASVRGQLQSHIYALLGAAELRPESGRLRLPAALPEARFSRPGSGLYAAIFGEGYRWQSHSTLGMALDWVRGLPAGEVRFAGPLDAPGGKVFRLAQGVIWETGDGASHHFTFNVIEDVAAYNAQVGEFRQTLWFWLGAAAILLVLLQIVLLRWSMQPLRAITRELARVEAGDQDRIQGRYPRELQGFRQHLNAFLRTERERLNRYRNTISDLAHSLKTPLAVLRGELEKCAPAAGESNTLLRQVERMDEIVAWRLKSAGRSGGRMLGVNTPIEPVAAQTIRALEKVYRDRGVSGRTEIDAGARFPGEKGDLYELLGNLLDNAFKWAAGRVLVRVYSVRAEHGRHLSILVEDDGPGIDPGRAPRLLRRGERGDERTPGQGIGLAMVDELVRAYGGQLHFERSGLGGARIRVELPAA